MQKMFAIINNESSEQVRWQVCFFSYLPALSRVSDLPFLKWSSQVSLCLSFMLISLSGLV